MCKYWVMFENGKITKTKLPKKGSYVLCSECGLIKDNKNKKPRGEQNDRKN